VLSRTWGGYSELLRRNSAVFRTARGWRAGDLSQFRTDTLINQALPELFVRSAGEALISRTLAALEIDFYYEKPLDGKDGGQPRRPDFTFRKSGQDWYLEHLGMLGKPEYDRDWRRKEQWYRQNGYHDHLLTTPIEGMTLARSLEDIFCGRFGYDHEAVRRAVAEEQSAS